MIKKEVKNMNEETINVKVVPMGQKMTNVELETGATLGDFKRLFAEQFGDLEGMQIRLNGEINNSNDARMLTGDVITIFDNPEGGMF
jgi:hypothetical protein